MQVERWEKVKSAFNEAVELDAPQRDDYLRSLNDETLRGEVEKLLAADLEAGTMADLFSSPENSLNQSQTQSYVDRQIGNYKIVRELGIGGMGAVFLATRDDLKKQVALKILKHEFSSIVLLNRFQNEREILAALEHPNIARLLDSGTTSDGLPYFVMEYVAGEDLLTFCRTNNLSFTERLKLFRKVCAAVAYAHSRLVVHRDLKPSNILVAETGEPKLLDFGISKLISENEPIEKGTVTSFGMLTPNYASPEQFRGETVSTATDIYSLGVILYELLTDTLPYQITNKRLDEVARAVCETEPERPSSVVSRPSLVEPNQTSENGRQKTKNDARNTNPKSKTQNLKSLKGDLDNILLKALRKEPSRRYSSVEKFSDDIRRHLEGLPVSARPDTFSYRAEKFINRNRVSVAVAALVFLLLLGGIVGVSSQYVRAERERQIAEKRFEQVRELANNIIYKYYDEITALSGSTKVRGILINDALNYLDNLRQDAAENDALQTEIAQAYYRIAKLQYSTYSDNLGDVNTAKQTFEKTMELQKSLFERNPNDEQTATALAATCISIGDIAAVEGDLSAAEEKYQKAQTLYENTLKTRRNDKTELNLANLLLKQAANLNVADAIEAEKYRQVIELAAQTLQQNPDDKNARSILALAYERLGSSLGHPEMSEAGDFDAAEIELKKSLTIRREMMEAEKDNIKLLNNYIISMTLLGDIMFAEKNFQEALNYYREAFEKREKLYSDDAASAFARSTFIYNSARLGAALSAVGRYDEATKILEKSKSICREFFLPKPDDVPSVNTCGKVFAAQGVNFANQNKLKNAVAENIESLEIWGKIIENIGDDNEIKGEIAAGNFRLGEIYLRANKREPAAENLRKSVALLEHIKAKEPLRFYQVQVLSEANRLLRQ